MSSTYGGSSSYQPDDGGGYPAGDTGSSSYQTTNDAYAGGASAAPSSRPDVEDQSVGSLVSRLTGDFTTLMRQEVALAKAELREEAKKAGKGAGMLGGAGVAGMMVLVFLSLMIMFLLWEIMALYWAALIVTILWAIIGFVLFTMGRKQLSEVNPKPEQTVESLKEDKEWVKAQKS